MPSVNSVANKFIKKFAQEAVDMRNYPLVAGKVQVPTTAEADKVRAYLKQRGLPYEVVVVHKGYRPYPRGAGFGAPWVDEAEALEMAKRKKQQFAKKLEEKRLQEETSGAAMTGPPMPSETSVKPSPARTTRISPRDYGDYVTIRNKRTGQSRKLQGEAARNWSKKEWLPYEYTNRAGERVTHPTKKWRDVWEVVR